jgi:hypothetical protein
MVLHPSAYIMMCLLICGSLHHNLLPTSLTRCCCWCPCSFKRYIDQVFAEHMDILSATVARAAAGSTQLDLHDLMYRFTLDSFGKIGFGVQLGCLNSSEAKVPFAAAFDQAQVVSVAAAVSTAVLL